MRSLAFDARDENGLTGHWRVAADSALRARDSRELLRLGGELEREGLFSAAWALLAEGGEVKKTSPLPPWDGPGSPGQCLLVRRHIRHLGAELRNARFLACAAQDVRKVVVATEARLIPLLSRTFPELTFADGADYEISDQADCEASYERLAYFYGSTREAIAATFRPLLPPPKGSAPSGLGIAWYSSNKRKELPSICEWADALREIDMPLRSLQYDEQEAGADELQETLGRVVHRSPIDQKKDIDGFAALVASVRAVLTISNTTAHMAGSLGIPCVVILDDLEHLTWPAKDDRTPFYPQLRTVRQRGRPWGDALAEGLMKLRSLTNSNRGRVTDVDQ